MAKTPKKTSEPAPSRRATDDGVKRYAFRIGRSGAQHRGKRGGVWHTWGQGDQIDLTMDQYHSGTYDNLGLEGPLVGGKVADFDLDDAEIIDASVSPPIRSTVQNAARTPDGTENQDVEDDEEDAGGNGEGGDDAAEAAKTKRKVNRLIKELEESSGAAESHAVREKVIAADLFEEGTVPTRKAELLQALIDLRDGNEPDAEDEEEEEEEK